MKHMMAVLVFFLMLGGVSASPASASAPLSLWRFDCGKFVIHNLPRSSTAPPGPWEIVSSCYLIRHGDDYMFWDAGLPEELIGKPDVSPEQTISLDKDIISQLAEINVRPEQISIIGVSHYHMDHIGQAIRFPQAKLLIGKADFAVLKTVPTPLGRRPELLRPWIDGKSSVVETEGDFDIFGDESVVMLATPGHTPGHNSLLVKLASGPVLLSGDFIHLREQLATNEVSGNSTDMEQAKVSLQRMKGLAEKLKAKIIVQHEPDDVGKLPSFPQAAR